MNRQRRILLFLLFATLKLSRAGISVNYYFNGLISYGIEQRDNMASFVISRVLRRIKHTDWKNVIIDLDIKMGDQEKRKIITEWERVHKRLGKITELMRRRRGYEGIPSHYPKRYRRAFRILEGIIMIAKRGTSRDDYRMNLYFEATFEMLEKVRGLRRQTKLFLLQIHSSANDYADGKF